MQIGIVLYAIIEVSGMFCPARSSTGPGALLTRVPRWGGWACVERGLEVEVLRFMITLL